MLTHSYMKAATMQNKHHTALFCPAHWMEAQRPVLPALLWNKASAGPAPWEMLFCNDELPSVGKRRTTTGSGSSPAHWSFSPWCIQIPPRTSSLLLYLDGHQTACCSSRGEAALLEPAYPRDVCTEPNPQLTATLEHSSTKQQPVKPSNECSHPRAHFHPN